MTKARRPTARRRKRPQRAKTPRRGEVRSLADALAPLVRQIQEAQAQARLLGLFPNDRELLTCPRCGLGEDVLSDGRLVTNVNPAEPDTGLRFIEPEREGARFRCPRCGAAARALSVL